MIPRSGFSGKLLYSVFPVWVGLCLGIGTGLSSDASAQSPVSFNLALCGEPPGQSRAGGSSTRTFCDPDGSCRSTGILGSILTVPR